MTGIGRLQGYGRYGGYGRQRTQQQNDEDEANARYLAAKAAGEEQQNQAVSPAAGNELGQLVSGLPRDVFRRATDLQNGGMPEGPIPEYGDITPAHTEAATQGNLARLKFLADPKTSLDEIYKAMTTRAQGQDYGRVIAGTLPADKFGDAVSASKGNSRYGVSDGTQYSNQVAGKFETTPVGTAKIRRENAAAGASSASAGKSKAETSKIQKGHYGPAVTVDVDGKPTSRFLGEVTGTGAVTVAPPKMFAPKGGAGGAGAEKVKPLSKSETVSMENHVADKIGGGDLKRVDPVTRATVLSRAYEMAVDPASPHHRNPLGAVDAAIGEIAPNGFEDSAGPFSSAKFIPRGGGSGTAAPTGNRPPKTGLPQEARAKLKEDAITKFGNGQTWTLQNGEAVQVQ
jgi:hypothetical protein